MIGILFIARKASTRLKNKHFLLTQEKLIFDWLLSRFEIAFNEEIKQGVVKLVICTSIKPENSAFNNFTINRPISLFQGDDENIPERINECASQFGFERLILVDGDDILCSVNAARCILNNLELNPNKFIISTNLPLGMNCFGFSHNLLKQSINSMTKLETGWTRIFSDSSLLEIRVPLDSKPFDDTILRFTLDYQEDFDFFDNIIRLIGEDLLIINDGEIIETVIKHKLFLLNSHLNEIYYTNFNNQIEKENNL